MTDIADIGGAAAGLVGLDETGVMGPVLHPPCCACAETEDDMRVRCRDARVGENDISRSLPLAVGGLRNIPTVQCAV